MGSRAGLGGALPALGAGPHLLQLYSPPWPYLGPGRSLWPNSGVGQWSSLGSLEPQAQGLSLSETPPSGGPPPPPTAPTPTPAGHPELVQFRGLH